MRRHRPWRRAPTTRAIGKHTIAGAAPPRWLYYDDASNIVGCDDQNANIDFAYYNDSLLKSETESINNYHNGIGRTVTYTYDADGRKATVQYPSGKKFKYDYSGRGQLYDIYDQTLVEEGKGVGSREGRGVAS